MLNYRASENTNNFMAKPQSNLQKVNVAHKRRNEFIQLHTGSKILELRLLYEIYKNKDWDNLGFEDFKSYCEAPVESGGLNISRAWAIEMALTYQKFVKELKLPEHRLLEVGTRKLYCIKNVVNQENYEDWIGKAKFLSLKDLDLEVKNIDINNCLHEELKTIYHCPKCKQWFKEKPNEN